MYVIRTKTVPAFYVHQMHGVVFLSYVTDPQRAKKWPSAESANEWAPVLSQYGKLELVAVRLADEQAARAAGGSDGN